MKPTFPLLAAACAFLGLADIGAAQCKSLFTLNAGNNQNSIGGQVFFDLDVTKASGILVESLDVNVSLTTVAGTIFTC